MNITHKGASEWFDLEKKLRIANEAFERMEEELKKIEKLLTEKDQSDRTIMDDLRTAAVLLTRDSGEIGYGMHLRFERFIEEVEKLLGHDKFGRKKP